MTLTPTIAGPGALEALRLDVDAWRPALDLVAGRHGLGGAPEAARSGTLPVFLLGDAVIKLYAPASFWDPGESPGAYPDLEAERAALRLTAGRLPIATPEILGDGQIGGWGYLAMRRLEGEPLEELLPRVAPDARREAMRGLGAAVAALHALDAGGFPSTVGDFDAFLARQEAEVVAVERARGAPPRWLEPLERFVRATPRGRPGRALLHTELGPGHVLAELDGERIELRGLIDWVDAMVGDPGYDLAAVAFFIARGDGELLAAFLDGYGWTDPRGEALGRRLMRYLLLHRYAPLRWLLARRPVTGARTIDDLVEPWIGALATDTR